jgi:putative transposase
VVDKDGSLSVRRYCALLDLPIMFLIDRCHLKYPFYGSRRIRGWLIDEGYCVNRKGANVSCAPWGSRPYTQVET